jgi:hypothetical protein
MNGSIISITRLPAAREGKRMQLTEAVGEAVTDASEPAAVLALAYAASIDEATHAPLGLADALALLAVAAMIADEQGSDLDEGPTRSGDTYARAHRKVAAALSAVSVASDLGPKLLSALDALLVTPKARAAGGAAIPPPPAAANPLQALRDRHDGRQLHSVG